MKSYPLSVESYPAFLRYRTVQKVIRRTRDQVRRLRVLRRLR